MTTLREAAEQMLRVACMCTPEQQIAKEALRTALAQQPQTPCDTAEDGVCEVIDCCRNSTQEEQEPALIVEKEPDYMSRGHFYEGSKPFIDPTLVWKLPIGTKLYTTQPPCPANDQPLNGRTLMRTEFHPWEKAAISPPNPGDFGIPKAYWEAAQHYANFWHQNRLDAARPPRREWRSLTEEDIQHPHPPAKPPVYATAQNTKSVRDGFEMGGYEKEPGYYSEEQLDEFARVIEAALKEKNNG